MSLTDLWRNMRDKLATQKQVPASEVLPRLRDSAKLQALSQPEAPPKDESSIRQVVPFAEELAGPPPEPIPPPPWDQVYPAHHKALVGDLAKRGENMTNWEIQDGADLGVSEAGHTVAFTLHKTGTSATIRVELTLFKGQLAKVRVR